MKPKRKSATKDKIKIPKSKHAIIRGVVNDWVFSPREGFPDVLGFPLEDAVKEIRKEPKLLYDENYILNFRPELVCQGESLFKVIIVELQKVFLGALQNPNTTETEKIERIVEARDWIVKIFDAAKFGIIDQVDFPGGHPPKDIIPNLKEEHDILCDRLTKFMNDNYPDYIENKKNFKRLLFPDGKGIDKVLIQFCNEINTGDGTLLEPVWVAGFSKIPIKGTDTIVKVVRIILANKYDRTTDAIKTLISRLNDK